SLALVRFGLRAPDDPRILNTVKVIDALLRVDLPQGPCWYRYNGDGYGEHEDGSPFDGTGIGRPWPLLTGERAHYELAAGNRESAESLLAALEHFTNGSRLIPEQVWDSTDLPDRELFRGEVSGSACPLVWAHAEYIKLRRSLLEGEIFDRPPQPVERYRVLKQIATHVDWRFNNKISSMSEAKILRLTLLTPALVHWSFDAWRTSRDTSTRDTGLGAYIVDLPTKQLLSPEELRKMNAYWRAANYLSVGQIYLLANPLLREPLKLEHVKPRLLGHWGTTPGLNFIYVHFNRLIRKYDLNVIYICGPGHGGPGMVANTYLEGTYTELYSSIQQSEEGLRRLFKQFSFPGGIPSHDA